MWCNLAPLLLIIHNENVLIHILKECTQDYRYWNVLAVKVKCTLLQCPGKTTNWHEIECERTESVLEEAPKVDYQHLIWRCFAKKLLNIQL